MLVPDHILCSGKTKYIYMFIEVEVASTFMCFSLGSDIARSTCAASFICFFGI